MRTLHHRIPLRYAALAYVAAVFVGGCVEVGLPAGEDTTWGELNPIQDMHDSPDYRDQEAQPHFDGQPPSMRTPPAKTTPVAFRPYAFRNTPTRGVQLGNPVPINAVTLDYGQLAYKTTCIVCHGPKGRGNGYVVGDQKFPQPPALTAQRARNFPDGKIFDIISNGQNRMWSYKSQLYPVERWAVVNYVRALQRADYPEPQDQRPGAER